MSVGTFWAGGIKIRLNFNNYVQLFAREHKNLLREWNILILYFEKDDTFYLTQADRSDMVINLSVHCKSVSMTNTHIFTYAFAYLCECAPTHTVQDFVLGSIIFTVYVCVCLSPHLPLNPLNASLRSEHINVCQYPFVCVCQACVCCGMLVLVS